MHKTILSISVAAALVTATFAVKTASAKTEDMNVVAVANGITITTGNSIATVEYRAKSFGPGFCAVEVSANSATKNILAPPLTWSSWQPLTSHIGSVSYTLGYDEKCDTGALVQVRYFP